MWEKYSRKKKFNSGRGLFSCDLWPSASYILPLGLNSIDPATCTLWHTGHTHTHRLTTGAHGFIFSLRTLNHRLSSMSQLLFAAEWERRNSEVICFTHPHIQSSHTLRMHTPRDSPIKQEARPWFRHPRKVEMRHVTVNLCLQEKGCRGRRACWKWDTFQHTGRKNALIWQLSVRASKVYTSGPLRTTAIGADVLVRTRSNFGPVEGIKERMRQRETGHLKDIWKMSFPVNPIEIYHKNSRGRSVLSCLKTPLPDHFKRSFPVDGSGYLCLEAGLTDRGLVW